MAAAILAVKRASVHQQFKLELHEEDPCNDGVLPAEFLDEQVSDAQLAATRYVADLDLLHNAAEKAKEQVQGLTITSSVDNAAEKVKAKEQCLAVSSAVETVCSAATSSGVAPDASAAASSAVGAASLVAEATSAGVAPDASAAASSAVGAAPLVAEATSSGVAPDASAAVSSAVGAASLVAEATSSAVSPTSAVVCSAATSSGVAPDASAAASSAVGTDSLVAEATSSAVAPTSTADGSEKLDGCLRERAASSASSTPECSPSVASSHNFSSLCRAEAADPPHGSVTPSTRTEAANPQDTLNRCDFEAPPGHSNTQDTQQAPMPPPSVNYSDDEFDDDFESEGEEESDSDGSESAELGSPRSEDAVAMAAVVESPRAEATVVSDPKPVDESPRAEEIPVSHPASAVESSGADDTAVSHPSLVDDAGRAEATAVSDACLVDESPRAEGIAANDPSLLEESRRAEATALSGPSSVDESIRAEAAGVRDAAVHMPPRDREIEQVAAPLHLPGIAEVIASAEDHLSSPAIAAAASDSTLCRTPDSKRADATTDCQGFGASSSPPKTCMPQGALPPVEVRKAVASQPVAQVEVNPTLEDVTPIQSADQEPPASALLTEILRRQRLQVSLAQSSQGESVANVNSTPEVLPSMSLELHWVPVPSEGMQNSGAGAASAGHEPSLAEAMEPLQSSRSSASSAPILSSSRTVQSSRSSASSAPISSSSRTGVRHPKITGKDSLTDAAISSRHQPQVVKTKSSGSLAELKEHARKHEVHMAQESEIRQLKDSVRQLAMDVFACFTDMEEAFKVFDADGDGKLTLEEFRIGTQSLYPVRFIGNVNRAFSVLDRKQQGFLERADFAVLKNIFWDVLREEKQRKSQAYVGLLPKLTVPAGSNSHQTEGNGHHTPSQKPRSRVGSLSGIDTALHSNGGGSNKSMGGDAHCSAITTPKACDPRSSSRQSLPLKQAGQMQVAQSCPSLQLPR